MTPTNLLAVILLADGLLILAWWLAFDRDPRPEPPAPSPQPPDTIKLWYRSAGHYYLVRYRPGQEEAVARQLGHWAANPELPLTPEEALELGERALDVAEVMEVRLCE